MANNQDKQNTQDRQMNTSGSQQGQGQQGKQSSGMGDQGGGKTGQSSSTQGGMKGGQSGSQGGQSSGRQMGSSTEGSEDETLDRGRRATAPGESTKDPTKKWSPSGGSEF